MRNIFLFATLFFLFGCGKDGAMGPQGEKGERGEQGEKGINGVNGNRILSGTMPPSNTLGANGDFFLDLKNGNLYGPKTNEGWGIPFNMKGEPGSSGIPGATILSGQSVPVISLGKNGDFYIDLKEMTIYGPKSNSGWGSPVSLKSNADNGVSVYILKPDWNKNLIYTDYVVDSEGIRRPKFTTISDEYAVPGNLTKVYNAVYVAGSEDRARILVNNMSLNKWNELTKSGSEYFYIFTSIRTGSVGFSEVKFKSQIASSNASAAKYKFSMTGIASDSGQTFDSNAVWVLIKSYSYTELKAKNKSTEELERYFRIK